MQLFFVCFFLGGGCITYKETSFISCIMFVCRSGRTNRFQFLYSSMPTDYGRLKGLVSLRYVTFHCYGGLEKWSHLEVLPCREISSIYSDYGRSMEVVSLRG